MLRVLCGRCGISSTGSLRSMLVVSVGHARYDGRIAQLTKALNCSGTCMTECVPDSGSSRARESKLVSILVSILA